MALLTRFRFLTEKWDGKRVFEAAGSAWGPTSTFTKNAGKWIHTDNQIKLTLTAPSFSCQAFFIPKCRKSSDFRYISNLTRLPRVARPLQGWGMKLVILSWKWYKCGKSYYSHQSLKSLCNPKYNHVERHYILTFCSSYNTLVLFGRVRFRSTRPFKILARNKRK